MAFSLNKVRDALPDDVEGQISALKREVASLRRQASKRGAAAYADSRDMASDIYEDLADRFSDALPEIRKQSRAVQKAAVDNPVATAVIGLAVIGLLAALFSRR